MARHYRKGSVADRKSLAGPETVLPGIPQLHKTLPNWARVRTEMVGSGLGCNRMCQITSIMFANATPASMPQSVLPPIAQKQGNFHK